MGEIAMMLGPIGNAVSIGSALTNIGMALFGGGKGISIPELPKIPQPDYESLNSQIQANQAITDQARQAAIKSLEAYNQGALSPAYQAMYESYLTQLEPQIQDMYSRQMQELASRGFSPGSTEYNNAMNTLAMNIEAAKAQYKNQLMSQQLSDAMKTAGLSDQTISDLYTKWATQMGQTQLEQQNWQSQVLGQALQSQLAQQRAGLLGAGLGQLGSSLKDVGKTGTTGTTGTSTTAKTSPWYMGTSEDWFKTMQGGGGGIDLGSYLQTT